MSLCINYFVSYARADKRIVQRLLGLLEPRLAIKQGFDFSHWFDDEILVGSRWTDEISDALASCDFGLLLVSPNFLASGFIRREELPTFIDSVRTPSGAFQTRIRKPVVPVLLEGIDLRGGDDLAGLEQVQIFRDAENRSFAQTSSNRSKVFADQLAAAIVTKLRKLHPAVGA